MWGKNIKKLSQNQINYQCQKNYFCYLFCYLLYWITLLYPILSLLIFYKSHVAYLIIHQDTSIYFNITLQDNILHSSIICTYQYELSSQIQQITPNYPHHPYPTWLTDNSGLSFSFPSTNFILYPKSFK